MSDLTISSGSLRLPGGGAASSGTPAEQAVQRAQKAYALANQRLLADARNQADEQVLKVDRAAVELAAGALAQAQAALARERRQADAGARTAESSARDVQRSQASGPGALAGRPVEDLVEVSSGPAADRGDVQASGSERQDRPEQERREHEARRVRHRPDGGLTALRTVDTLA